MNKPATEAQPNQARRNQEFTNVPFGRGQCGLKAPQVAIFPVRYALDESPTTKGSPQGPHPLPKGWSGAPAPLQTRSYTLRQLRDGWLYVWDSVDRTFHEYQVSAEYFTRHQWNDAQLNQDVRINPGETHPYLLYPRRSKLRIAYSPVQWTWRICELMRSSATQQTRWMREVDLPVFCSSGNARHGGPITELGDSVADILVEGAQIPAFTSTLLPTIASESGAPFKPVFEEALVRGRVPEQDTALFIALDDPLAMIDDLSMNLTGRLLEQSQFEGEHQRTLEGAVTVQNLCGFDVDAFMPSTLESPYQRQAYTDDMYALLNVHDEIEFGRVPDNQSSMVDVVGPSLIADAQTRFKATWGHLPNGARWQTALEEWNEKRLWREDVRFDEAQKYLSQTTSRAQRLQSHCQRSELDLITWLDQLSASAETVFHDTCDEAQASQLLETAHGIYTALGNGENGRKWLCNQVTQQSTLFGLALFNFNPEVAALIKQVTENFSATGTLDDLGLEGDGSSPALTLGSAGDATSLGSRVNEVKSVFDLKTVQKTKAYRAMSNAAKHAMTTLIKVANHRARDAWHGLSLFLLPAMTHRTALDFAARQVLISTEISNRTRLAFNPNFERDFRAWLMEVTTLRNKMRAYQSVLFRAGQAHDQRAARVALHAHEEQLKTLFLKRPHRIIGAASGSTRLPGEMAQINRWLADLGQSEAMGQLKVVGKPAHLTRTNAWTSQNLGNALPVLLVALNLWNFHATAENAFNDGQITAKEWRGFGASAAYAGNAIAALWVGPAWSRAGGMSTTLNKETRKVAQAGYTQWLKAARAATDGSAQAAASEFAAVSKGLILRTVTWAALGAVAAGLEAWQLSNEIDRATSEEERILLAWKQYSVGAMAFTGSIQLIGTGLGYWFGFAWVMSTPVTVILLILGIAYLMTTMAANRFKREGLRLWLYHCSWGRGANPEWLGDAGHVKQMQALLETLQRPSVTGTSYYFGGGDTPREWRGFWVQILLPAGLAGKELTLQPAIIRKNYLSEDDLEYPYEGFYHTLLEGNWINPALFGTVPFRTGDRMRPADFAYTGKEQHRLWQVWIDTRTNNPVLELEIKYPGDVLQRPDERSYFFRLLMGRTTKEAERVNSALNRQVTERNDLVLGKKSTERVKLAVPLHVKY